MSANLVEEMLALAAEQWPDEPGEWSIEDYGCGVALLVRTKDSTKIKIGIDHERATLLLLHLLRNESQRRVSEENIRQQRATLAHRASVRPPPPVQHVGTMLPQQPYPPAPSFAPQPWNTVEDDDDERRRGLAADVLSLAPIIEAVADAFTSTSESSSSSSSDSSWSGGGGDFGGAGASGSWDSGSSDSGGGSDGGSFSND